MMYNKLFWSILSFCLISLFVSDLNAQSRRIGIVFNADTTVICQHVGLTIFSNSTNELPLGIDIPQLITSKLLDSLSNKHQVANILLPDSLRGVKAGVFESGISKKITKWARTKGDEYDLIIFIINSESRGIPYNTSGVYSADGKAFLYTTITFSVYDISKAKLIYNGQVTGGKWFPKLKDIKLPKNKKNFDADLLKILKEKFESFLEERVDYFLSKAKFVPDKKSEKEDAMKWEP